MGSNNKLKELLQEARANTLKLQAFKEATIPYNEFFEGVVVNSTKPNETFKIKHAGTGVSLEKEFIWVGGVLSSFVGFKTSFMPPLGSKVLCYIPEHGAGLVVGCLPSKDRYTFMPERQTGITKEEYKVAQTFTDQANIKEMPSYNEHRPFMDLLEGEVDISNEMGIGITLLQYMAKIKAGDLAKIELSTIDDMVRIVSGCFEHITPFGDLKIFADGDRINSIWNGVLFDHESYGLTAPEQQRVPTENYEAFYDKSDLNDRHELTGRWRFSQFLGYLGNLVNIFVSDPVQTLGVIAANAKPRSGLGRIHVNEDGSIIAQSVHDIVLERVVRVLVPVETKPEYHPEGNLSNEVLKPDPLKKWDFKSTPNMFEAVYQIREYTRWLSNYYSLARFHMMDKDYKVFSEAETPLHKEAHMDFEREKVPTPMYWQELYSCIKIMRDGSIVAMDGYANSIVMNKKGIHIASANNLHIESAGNVNIVAGHDINLVANRSIAVNAINEGLILRAKKWFQGICLENGILLQSDGTGTTDDPDSDEHLTGGIVLKSKSKIRLNAFRDIELKTTYGSIVAYAFNFFNKIKGVFRINQTLEVNQTNTSSKGTLLLEKVVAQQVAVSKTLKSGMGPHPGHVMPLTSPIPVIILPSEEAETLAASEEKADFRHATPQQAKMPSPDTETLYESLTQQQIKTAPPITLDQQGFATWNLASECKIEGKGSCWPIDGTTHKICRGGDDLYVTSGKTVFPAEGTPLESEAVTYKVKPD